MEEKYAYDMTAVCVCFCVPFQLWKQLIDFHKIWCKCYWRPPHPCIF